MCPLYKRASSAPPRPGTEFTQILTVYLNSKHRPCPPSNIDFICGSDKNDWSQGRPAKWSMCLLEFVTFVWEEPISSFNNFLSKAKRLNAKWSAHNFLLTEPERRPYAGTTTNKYFLKFVLTHSWHSLCWSGWSFPFNKLTLNTCSVSRAEHNKGRE